MLKKNQPVKFTRPGTKMETVYNLVRDGVSSKHMLILKSKLKASQVSTALLGLVFTGMLETLQDGEVTRYYLLGQTPEPHKDNTKNSICISKNKGGRPKKKDKRKPVLFRPQSKEAREAFYRMGGSRWINRVLEGLAQ